MSPEKMPTPGGLSVRREIDIRLADARTAAIEEVIGFLEAAGHAAAAADLKRAAFESTEEAKHG